MIYLELGSCFTCINSPQMCACSSACNAITTIICSAKYAVLQVGSYVTYEAAALRRGTGGSYC